MKIGAFEAKTHFSEIIENVRSGKDYTITRRGKPVARIVPISGAKTLRKDIIRELSSYRNSNNQAFDIKKAIAEGRR